MRRILLALIVLGCSMPTADAARRDDTNRTTASRSAQAQKPPQQQARAAAPRQQAASRSTTRTASRQQATSRQQSTSRQQATSRNATQRSAALRPGDARSTRNGVAVRGASAAAAPRSAAQSCTRRNGRTHCTPARSSVVGWQSGLPTASYAQQECPAGTFATLARGHDDVVRCMPL
jgi:hypothetical protein